MKSRLQLLVDEWIAEADKRGLNGKAINEYANWMSHQYRAVKRVNIP